MSGGNSLSGGNGLCPYAPRANTTKRRRRMSDRTTGDRPNRRFLFASCGNTIQTAWNGSQQHAREEMTLSASCIWPKSWRAANTMSVEFDLKIHDTLADANLQLAIYTATLRLKGKRIEVTSAGELPDYQELRTQANALKKHAIDNLDHYLEEFERNVEARGGKVVYCKDATEVSDFVLDLARRRGSRLKTTLP